MRKLLTSLMFFITIGNCLGQGLEIFGIEYARYPNATVSDADSVDLNFTEFEISMFAPLISKEKLTFLGGATYRLVTPESNISEIENSLFFLGVRMAGIYRLSENKLLIINAFPAISTSNENGSFAWDNLLMQGGVLFRNQISERFNYTVGVISTSRFGAPLVLPSLGFSYLGEKMKLDINLPFLIQTLWNHQNSFSYGLKIAVNGSQYNFNDRLYNGNEIDLARFSRVRLGTEIQYRIKGPLVLKLYGGIAVNRRYDFKLEGLDDIDLSVENGPFISVRLALIPNKINKIYKL